MGAEGFVVVGLGLLMGFAFVKLYTKTKFGKKMMENRNPRDKVLNNPELLVKKLTEGKEFIDDGKDMNYSVVEEDGKKIVKLDLGKQRELPVIKEKEKVSCNKAKKKKPAAKPSGKKKPGSKK